MQSVSQRFHSQLKAMFWGLIAVLSSSIGLADDALLRRQADELAPLLSHYGALLGPPDRSTHIRDDEKFRETARRLSQEGANAELQEIARQCVTIAAKLDKSHTLYDELTKDRPGPGKNIFQMMQWVSEQSAKGAFRWETTTVRREHNWTITETSVKDHTLEAAVFYGSIGMIMNREAERQHQVAVFKLRQAVAKELIKVGDEVEQLRLKTHERLRDQYFVPAAGAPRIEPRLEFKMGRSDPQGTPIEEEWQQRARRSPKDSRPPTPEEERQRQEAMTQQVHPFLRVRNPGPTLHRVLLTIDYVHYRWPQEPVMRQIYWIPEWKADETFAVTEAFRLNLKNRAVAGLADDINELRGSCGQQMFPGFLGLLSAKYSLASDELRQESVEINFDANRTLIRDSMLRSAEDLAYRLTAAATNRDEWVGLNPTDKSNRLKVMTNASRDCAKLALDLAPADWPETEHAKALSKDFKVISKKFESLQQAALQGCADGRVYVGVRESQYAQFTHQQGRFAIEFQSTKPTAQHIDVVITRPANGVNPDDSKGFVGRLIPNPRDRTEVILSLKPAPKSQLAGKKPAKTGSKTNDEPDKTETRTKANPVDVRNSKTPGLAWFEMEWQLLWVKDHWECVNDQTEFTYTETKASEQTAAKKTGEFVDRPKPKPTGAQAALNQGPTGFADKSVWEGTRKVAGPNGKAIKEEKAQLTILFRVSENPGTGGGTYKAELTLDGQRKSEVQISVNMPVAGRISWMSVVTPRPGERFPRGSDPYAGTVKNGTIEVLSERTTDQPNAENSLIQLRLKK